MTNDKKCLGKYPICDTDIWVDLILGEIINRLFEKYKKIMIADVVEKEILNFQQNPQFSRIAVIYKEYKQNGSIFVIKHDNIPEEDRKLLERQLLDCNMRFSSGLADDPHEKNKGEIVSAIYAEYYHLPFLKSNDTIFNSGREGRKAFPELIVKNRKDTVKDLLDDQYKQQECHQLIKDCRDLMNENKRIYEKQQLTKEEMENSIHKLLRKFRGNH